jgi:ATP-dependent protease ClpP protease subunit
MSAILEDGKLRLSGYVGDYYFEDGFTSGDVVLALAQIDDDADLVVYVNSGGGIASEGAAIHALLSARSGTTDVVVEGIAASAASLITMAGDTVTMSAGAVMMIHDPSGYTFGNSTDHTKTIEALEALATAYSRVYAAKSGKTPEECREIMKAERWFTPEDAVKEGFADDTTEVKAEPVAAFDYRAYAHAPKRLTALAAKKDWRLPDAENRTASSAASHRPQTKEKTMSVQKNGGDDTADIEKAKADAGKSAVAAYQARRKAVMALEEAAGREALAEHLVDETEMTVDTIKATLAVSPKASATEEPEPEQEFQPRRMNAQGLNNSPAGSKPSGKAAMRVDLVADMKRRHGVK